MSRAVIGVLAKKVEVSSVYCRMWVKWDANHIVSEMRNIESHYHQSYEIINIIK